MLSPPVSAGYLRAVAATTFLTTAFALVWGVSGSFALPGSTRIVCMLVVLCISALFFGMAFTFTRAARHLPPAATHTAHLFRNRLYQGAVVAQFVAIFLVARFLTAIDYPDAIISAVASIVGLHFFALIPVFQSWRFAAVGGAMILLGLGSLLVAPDMTLTSTGEILALRTAIVGLGCAIILWAGVLPLVLVTQHRMQHTSC